MAEDKKPAEAKPAKPAKPEAPAYEPLVFSPAGAPQKDQFGIETRTYTAATPNGRFVWISRTHVNATLGAGSVRMSDALAFEPNQP